MTTTPEPRDVVLAALATTPPCPVCGSLTTCPCIRPDDWTPLQGQADVVVAALREQGMLPQPVNPDATESLDEVAQWLADMANHPRYNGDGWHRVRESEADIHVVATAAARNAATADETQAVASAKAALTRDLTHGPRDV